MTDLVDLRGGLVVPADALRLALALEDRGHRLTAHNGLLHATNGSALTAEDRAEIRQWKLHLLAIAEYQA